MGAIANLTLADDQGTPVNHIFAHKSHSNSSISYVDSTAGLTLLSRPELSFSRIPSKDRNLRKYRIKLVIPVMDTVSGNTSEGYVAEPKRIGSVEVVEDFIVHTRATEQAVKDARKYMASVSITSQFTDLLYMDQMPY